MYPTTTAVFGLVHLLLSISIHHAEPDHLTVDIWVQYIRQNPDGGHYTFGSCVAYHYCDTLSEEARALISAVSDRVSDVISGPLPVDNNSQKGCSCNIDDCSVAGDCCEDLEAQISLKSPPLQCISQYEDERWPFYAVTSCPVDYSNIEVAERCRTPIEELTAQPDLLHWFVSSDTTLITHRNIYCALCNGESINDLTFLPLDLECPPPPSAVEDQTTSSPLQLLTYFTSSCTVHFSINHQSRWCLDTRLITTCPQNYQNSSIRERCESGPQALVTLRGGYPDKLIYHNIFCVVCHNDSLSDIECGENTESIIRLNLRVIIQPFSYTCEESVGIYQRDNPDCTSLHTVLLECEQREIYDWTSKQCVSLCSSPFEWSDGECLLPPSAVSIPAIESIEVSRPNITTSSPRTNQSAANGCYQLSHDELEDEFSDLSQYTLEYTHDSIRFKHINSTKTYCVFCYWHINSEDEVKESFSRIITSDGEIFLAPLYVPHINDSVAVCRSNHLNEYSLLGEVCFHVEDTATVVMLCISIVCLALMIIVYCILPILHNVPGYIVLCKISALMLGKVLFLLRLPAENNPIGCYVVSILTHYSFLAAYFWSVLFAIEIVMTVSSLNAVNQKSKKKFIRYSAVGWTIPLIPLIIALVIDNTYPDSNVAPQYGLPQCWLNSAYGIQIYFLLPLAVMFIANLVIFIVIVVKFSILAYQSRRVRHHHKEKIILTLKLFFAFGLLWSFGLLSAVFPSNAAMSCMFIFINSLIGLILSIVFLANRSVFNAVRKQWISYRHENTHTKGTNIATSNTQTATGTV